MENLTGKNIIITGASSGLGFETAKELVKSGANLILVARREDKLNASVEKLDSKNIVQIPCDIRNKDQIYESVNRILVELDHIDILINNAGVWTDNDIEEKNDNSIENTFNTNAIGNIRFTYALLDTFKNQGFGHIVNVISTAGVLGIPEGNNEMWMTYGATKWAMTGFTNALQNSLQSSGIKVSGFFPGGFESDLYESAGRENTHNQPWMMDTDKVADALIYMISQPDKINIKSMVVTKV